MKRLTVAMRTRERLDNQLTLRKFFLEELVNKLDWIDLRILVPEFERQEYKRKHSWTAKYLRSVPDDFRCGDTSQFISDNFKNDYVLSLDDDLQLDRRRNPLTTSQAGAAGTFQDVCDAMLRVKHWLNKGYAHGGFSLRPYNFQIEGSASKENCRICRAMFWNNKVVKQEGLRFDDTTSRSDFHMTLSLLELGFPNICDFEFMVGENGAGKGDKGGTNTPGGCSRYRTPEFQLAQAELLKKLHPETVSVIFKSKVSPSAMKMAISGKGIPDVRVQWAKALGLKSNQRVSEYPKMKVI